MKSIELFAGAGGLALGLASAGFKHKAVIDFSENACTTIRENQLRDRKLVKDWNIFQIDVAQFKFCDIKDAIDVVSGGPPCQPFSIGGKHRGYSDRRDMFPHAVRAVRELQPKAFIFENVKGILRKSFSTYFEYIILQLSYPEILLKNGENWLDHLSRLEQCHTRGNYEGLKYRTIFRLLNAVDYGIPQKRERVFIVGFRSDLDAAWSFPQPTHSRQALLWSQWVTGDYWEEHNIPISQRPTISKSLESEVKKLTDSYSLFAPCSQRWQTVRDVLKGLPHPLESANSQFMNHEFRAGARVYPGHTGSYLDEPAKALKAGDHGVPGGENMLRYPDGTVRYFSVRESARLQTFPDDYVIHGSWTESMRQLGNAVPVRLAEILAASIREQIVRKAE